MDNSGFFVYLRNRFGNLTGVSSCLRQRALNKGINAPTPALFPPVRQRGKTQAFKRGQPSALRAADQQELP
jgi:hypothetical protein